jgi:phage tail-like protein
MSESLDPASLSERFNFLVSFGDGMDWVLLGGFSEVTGLDDLNKTSEVTLKRGLVDSGQLSTWLHSAREPIHHPRTLTVALLDETGVPVRTWILRNARPMKWTGPTLAAKGGGDVAIEELQLTSEGIELS